MQTAGLKVNVGGKKGEEMYIKFSEWKCGLLFIQYFNILRQLQR